MKNTKHCPVCGELLGPSTSCDQLDHSYYLQDCGNEEELYIINMSGQTVRVINNYLNKLYNISSSKKYELWRDIYKSDSPIEMDNNIFNKVKTIMMLT